MQPEQSIKQAQFQNIHINGTWQKIAFRNTSASHPNNYHLRKNHLCVPYKSNSLYFYGGEPLSRDNHGNMEAENIRDNNTQSIAKLHDFSLYQNLHRLDFIEKQWTVHPLNLPPNSNTFNHISRHSGIIVANFIYIFGGWNYKNNNLRPHQLWTMNSDTHVIRKIETKGTPPRSRCNPIMAQLSKNNILVFGGWIYNEYLNDMYLYKISQKSWLKIQQSYMNSVPKLIDPCIAPFGQNNFYLFGGYREVVFDTQIEKMPNHTFYKIRLVGKSVSPRPETQVKIVQSNLPELQAYSGQMWNISEKYIILLQYDKQTKRYEDAWIFNPNYITWIHIKHKNTQLMKLVENNCNFMVSNQSIFVIQNGGIYVLDLQIGSLLKDMEKKKEKITIRSCSLCVSQQQYWPIPKKINTNMFKTFLEPLQFPFAAIGLLVDNSLVSKAKQCNLYFMHTVSDQKFILIEDNGDPKLIWGNSDQSFEKTVSKFYAGCLDSVLSEADLKIQTNQALQQLDRKDKKREKQLNQFLKQARKGESVPGKSQKDFEKESVQSLDKRHHLLYKSKLQQMHRNQINYIKNLKLGSLRLGDLVIFVSNEKVIKDANGNSKVAMNAQNLKQIRRFMIIHIENKQKDGVEEHMDDESVYVCYNFVTENGNLVNPAQESEMKYLMKIYKREFKIISDKLKNSTNIVYISNLRKTQQVQEQIFGNEQGHNMQLHFRRKYNDIFAGNAATLTALDAKTHINLNQCCDVSLKTYLSLLYLKNQEMGISISVKQSPLQSISNQKFLNTIDKLAKTKKIQQVQQCLNFTCNIVQVYYYADKNKQESRADNSFINNGVLIYQNQRLITRYKINLGKLIENTDFDMSGGLLFGYINVQDNFAVNTFKTNFLFPGAMEPFYSRMQFITQYMRRNMGTHLKHHNQSRRQDFSGQKITKRIKID